MKEPTVWGIHGGKTGDADALFLKKGFVALGWDKVGDMNKYGADREAIKAAITKHYPNKKPGAIPVDAGQLYRFVHELAVGDVVIYPSKFDRQIHLGRITGNYVYDSKTEPGYPNLRAVQWGTSLPRTRFSQGALHESNSMMSFFQIRNYASEFLAALEGKVSAPA